MTATFDINTVWGECLDIIKDNLSSSASFDTWIRPIVPQCYNTEDSRFVLGVPSMFFFEYIEEHFSELIRAVLCKVMRTNLGISYEVIVDRVHGKNMNIVSTQSTNPDQKQVPASVKQKTEQSPFVNDAPQEFDSRLNPDYNFNTFIEGKSNKFARAAAINIASKPGSSPFNPFFVHGDPTVGKTHLVQALGNAIKKQFPQKKVLFVSANEFKLQYTNAARRDRNDTDINYFLNFYQQMDVLIIDDIQEFSGLRGTQNAFFNIFDYLHKMNKQLIFTSDASPSELKDIDDRILSRFQWGLRVEIEKPDLELRKSILRSHAAANGLDIPENVFSYVAEQITDNVRNLIGTQTSLLARSILLGEKITLELAKQVIGKPNEKVQKIVTVEQILEVVCNFFHVTEQDVQSKSRLKDVAVARQTSMYLAKNYTNLSFKAIGDAIGGRDHATVHHSYNQIANALTHDRHYKLQYQEILEDLLGT